ncbi:PilZ domain-containing protein [Marinospirillum sp. MEB164]|uniref:PilZ domain-containing protein n=1 Tax=Marinospirillum alkalitolerans TaxID=3123374 RepID=A0ABW8PV98_9GAMM
MATLPASQEQLTGQKLRLAIDEGIQHQLIRLQPMEKDDLPNGDQTWKVDRVLLVRETQRLKLTLSANEADLAFLAKHHLFRVYVKFRNLLHHSEPLEVERIQPGTKNLTLELPLPQQLTQVFHREFFRVYVAGHLNIEAEVQTSIGSLRGQLADLSASGCRIQLPPQMALHLLRPLDPLFRVRLIFPSQKDIHTPFEMTYLRPDDQFEHALLGCHFLHADQDEERRFFRLTLDVERELAKVTRQDQNHKRSSSLFLAPSKSSHHRPVKATSKPLPSLIQPEQRKKIQRMADLLACQAFLIALQENLNAKMMQQLASSLLQELEKDEQGFIFALNQPHPKIHPTILHSLRVAARSFPLMMKIGVSHRIELAVMASLLVHDLGKLFVSRHPCFNPLKLSPEHLRSMKRQHIAVLRSTASMKWIPQRIGESIIVNSNERLDGSGYPRGLAGEKLDSLARTVGLVKVLDCLVSGLNDPAVTWRDAYRWVGQHKEWFDTGLLKRFMQHYGLRPLGAYIEFGDGKVASVNRVDTQGIATSVILIEGNDPGSEVKLTPELVEQWGGIKAEVLAPPVEEA